jgi:hypothetical protein
MTRLQTFACLAVAMICLCGSLSAQKEKKEQGPAVQGTVKSVDAGKNILVVDVRTDPVKKTTEEKRFPVAADSQIILADTLSKKEKPPAGKLADLSEGTWVHLQLSVDGKSVVAISAHGPAYIGMVKAADKNSITISVKEKGGHAEKKLALVKDIRIIKDDGLSKKKTDAPKEGTIADLAEGVSVHVQVSVDRKRALGIQIQGASLHGTLKSYDAGNKTLTVTVKEDAQIVDKDLTLVEGARIEGELTADSRVAVTLSVYDKSKAAAVRVLKD